MEEIYNYKKYMVLGIFGIFLILISLAYYFGSNSCKCKGIELYDGIWIKNISNHATALQTAQKYNTYGDWICINIKNATYKRAVEICKHEVGHEIFAEECEKNFTKCEEIIR